jgi:hypothetical protein
LRCHGCGVSWTIIYLAINVVLADFAAVSFAAIVIVIVIVIHFTTILARVRGKWIWRRFVGRQNGRCRVVKTTGVARQNDKSRESQNVTIPE